MGEIFLNKFIVHIGVSGGSKQKQKGPEKGGQKRYHMLSLFSLVLLLLVLCGCAEAVNSKGRKGPRQPVDKRPRHPKPPKRCSSEKAIQVVRQMIKQWPDYVNTANAEFLLKNWVERGATIETVGDPFNLRCENRVESFADYLFFRESTRVLSDVVNIKSLQYRKDGSVRANFVLAAGIKGHNLALYNEDWTFYPKCGCDYVVSEGYEIKMACLDQSLMNNFDSHCKRQ